MKTLTRLSLGWIFLIFLSSTTISVPSALSSTSLSEDKDHDPSPLKKTTLSLEVKSETSSLKPLLPNEVLLIIFKSHPSLFPVISHLNREWHIWGKQKLAAFLRTRIHDLAKRERRVME